MVELAKFAHLEIVRTIFSHERSFALVVEDSRTIREIVEISSCTAVLGVGTHFEDFCVGSVAFSVLILSELTRILAVVDFRVFVFNADPLGKCVENLLQSRLLDRVLDDLEISVHFVFLKIAEKVLELVISLDFVPEKRLIVLENARGAEMLHDLVLDIAS